MKTKGSFKRNHGQKQEKIEQQIPFQINTLAQNQSNTRSRNGIRNGQARTVTVQDLQAWDPEIMIKSLQQQQIQMQNLQARILDQRKQDEQAQRNISQQLYQRKSNQSFNSGMLNYDPSIVSLTHNTTIETPTDDHGPKRKNNFVQMPAREKTKFFNNLVYSQIAAQKESSRAHSFTKERRFSDIRVIVQSQEDKSPRANNQTEYPPSQNKSFVSLISVGSNKQLGIFTPGPNDYSPQYHQQSKPQPSFRLK